MQEQATAILITNIVQAGLGAIALALLLFSFGPRLKRISRRVLRLERARGIVTPPRGVPVTPQDFDENTQH